MTLMAFDLVLHRELPESQRAYVIRNHNDTKSARTKKAPAILLSLAIPLQS